MLSALVSTIIILFVLVSFGDILISLYNRICKCNERYNLLDTFLLGMCFILLPLSLFSFFVPINHYILLICILSSIIYWCIARKRRKQIIDNIYNIYNNLSWRQIILLSIASFIIILNSTVYSCLPDSFLYHWGNIRWTEDYPIIPGLANLEDRYGFNSNYILISSVFTLRFIFGAGIYAMLQTVLFLLFINWILIKTFTSRYNIIYLLAWFCVFAFYISYFASLSNTNTDILPNICILYLLVKFVTSPSICTKQILLFIFLPIVLVTFKLSSGVFCLICIIPIIFLIKRKKWKILTTTILLPASLVIVWMVRNVIISGYLIYPLHQIDVFNFDWKVPPIVAAIQEDFIYTFAKVVVFDMYWTYDVCIYSYLSEGRLFGIPTGLPYIAFYFFVFTSPLFILFSLVKKQKIAINIYLLYVLIAICIIFWYLTAPDPRFISGLIWGGIFVIGCIFIYSIKIVKKCFPKYGYMFILLTLLYSCLYTYKALNSSAISWNAMISEMGSSKLKEKELSIWNHNYQIFKIDEYSKALPIHKVGNISFAIFQDISFDVALSATKEGLPRTFTGNKVQCIESLEMRGSSIYNGFRTKDEYKIYFEENKEQVWLIYKQELDKKINRWAKRR